MRRKVHKFRVSRRSKPCPGLSEPVKVELSCEVSYTNRYRDLLHIDQGKLLGSLTKINLIMDEHLKDQSFFVRTPKGFYEPVSYLPLVFLSNLIDLASEGLSDVVVVSRQLFGAFELGETSPICCLALKFGMITCDMRLGFRSTMLSSVDHRSERC
jgi:hypothetical protein